MKLYSEEFLVNGVEKFEPFTVTPSMSPFTWEVPRGIKEVRIDCCAGQGYSQGSVRGGLGGRVQCTLKVRSKQILYLVVGAQHQNTLNFYNASDIRLNLSDINSRILVAGGGGCSSLGSHYATWQANGGNGGGLVGQDGFLQTNSGGTVATGGTQSVGGTGATTSAPYMGTTSGGPGHLGYGGNRYAGYQSGYGGDGYYGGGGGSVLTFASEQGFWGSAAGGGGGSSYTNPNYCTDVIHTQGYRAGNGYITISIV